VVDSHAREEKDDCVIVSTTFIPACQLIRRELAAFSAAGFRFWSILHASAQRPRGLYQSRSGTVFTFADRQFSVTGPEENEIGASGLDDLSPTAGLLNIRGRGTRCNILQTIKDDSSRRTEGDDTEQETPRAGVAVSCESQLSS
jgi:hypothetical protein